MSNYNEEFLQKLQEAFCLYLKYGGRSNEKLKPIHSFIANTLLNCLGSFSCSVSSLGPDKKGGEKTVPGYYMDKSVDVAVCQDDKVVAALGFKFVMSNYKQNSNNYFENMLGETANIRCAGIPYFQVLVLLKKFPYYEKDGNIKSWEIVDEHNLSKYIQLSKDNIKSFFHAPVKTLLYVLSLPENDSLKNKGDYIRFYKNASFGLNADFNHKFGPGVIVNDFNTFIRKMAHYIQSV